jgi:hypothetical protein
MKQENNEFIKEIWDMNPQNTNEDWKTRAGVLAIAIKGSTREEYPADLCNLLDFIESEINSAVSEAKKQFKKEIVQEIERFIKPAETSRGQGGLPKYGEVKDWEIHLTKGGWEIIKLNILDESND